LGFPGIGIFRPSVLEGRPDDGRIGEKILQKVSPLLSALLIGPLRPYAFIHVRTVAKAMVYFPLVEFSGLRVFDGSGEIIDFVARMENK